MLETLRELGAVVELTEAMLLAYAQAGNVAAVNLLLSYDVSPKAGTRSGDTAFDLAVRNGHAEVARVLRAAGGTGEETAGALAAYARDGETASVRALLASGVPVDEPNRAGGTALLEASRAGEVEMSKLLLDAGADIGRADGEGRTALVLAVLAESLPTVELLLVRGCPVNARDDRGETALHPAAARGYPEISQALLRHGADTDVQDNDGDTPLIAAVLEREPRIVGLLVQGGCDVNLPTVARRSAGNKASPLGIALWISSRNTRDEDAKQIVQILRGAGAQE
jgi:hypothetical protein